MSDQFRVANEPAIVLHTRPYRETSLMAAVFSFNHGRLTLVARGLRGSKRGRPLQPFSEMRLGWSGRGSLATLTGLEPEHQYWFRGDRLASAFYLAELIMRLVGEREVHPKLYAGLSWSLANLETAPSRVLRSFEKLLLEELGYGLDFQRDLRGAPLVAGAHYRLIPDRGFEQAESGYPGDGLLSIGQEDFQDPETRRLARRVFGEALAAHLGPKPLMSRRLLVGGPR